MNSTKSSLKSNFLYNFIFGTPMKRVATFERVAIMIDGEAEKSPTAKSPTAKSPPVNVVTEYDNFTDIEQNGLEETDADVATRGILQSASNSNNRNYLILFILSSITGFGGYFVHKYCRHLGAYCPAFLSRK